MPGAWHGYRLSWIKMFPILPGLLPSLLVRRFGSDSDVLMFVLATIMTFLLAAIAMHFYSIILAMAFVNALNETAREADVFRMFARGQGYLATFKCQQAFRRGAGFCMLAIP